MTCCSHCEDAEGLFNARAAKRDLRRYRRRGPPRTTRLLVRALLARRGGAETLLDVGGGVGAIQHELIRAGFSRAVHVDASAAYLAASEKEASRLGHRELVEYRHGDFVEVAPALDAADVVTLDRVVCCYPDMERLITASAGKARRLYGLVLPRESLLNRVGVAGSNVLFRLRRSAFRTFLHATVEVDAVIRRAGFRRRYATETLLWRVVVYART